MTGIRWNARRNPAAPAHGFTLVELLVVIAIIALLAAILIPVAFRATIAAKQAVVATEVGEISKVLEQFKTQYGSYPPDFSGAPAQDGPQIDQFLNRNFRTRNPAVDLPMNPATHALYASWTAVPGLDPSEALFFWLGGSPPDPTTTSSGGFSKDPLRPKVGAGDRTPMFAFDKARLKDVDADGFLEYYPQGINKPYVYLCSTNYMVSGNPTLSLPITTGDVVRPYRTVFNASPVQQNFVNDTTYQLITAGLDSEFGLPTDATNTNLYPAGPYPDTRHRDNITNFAGTALENKLP